MGFRKLQVHSYQRSKCKENYDILHHNHKVHGCNYNSLYRTGGADVDLTNREALTVFCSVVKYAGSG